METLLAGMGVMDLQGFFTEILKLINTVFIPLIFSAAFVLVLFGAFRYFIVGGADEEKRQEGKSFILYGIIGLAVMFSIWGLVNIVSNTFGFTADTQPELPLF